jgi:uncharacterized membrane protein
MSLPPLYLMHPPVVHFPIALLTVGWVVALLGRRREAAAQAASWLLWAGTLSAWAALGLGLLAEKTAPHVPPAWQTLNRHETLAYWTVGLFTALSLWRWRLGRKAETLFLAAWLAACGVLLATGYEGGELVFTHGMGVASE